MFLRKAANYLRTNLQRLVSQSTVILISEILQDCFCVAQQPNSDLGCFFRFLDRTHTHTHTHTHTQHTHTHTHKHKVGLL